MTAQRLHTLISVVVLLTLLIQPLGMGAASPAPAEPVAPAHLSDPKHPGYLFRASLTLAGSRNLARLEKTGVQVLETFDADGEQTALVLVDGEQLADLARLGFRPQAADELRLTGERAGAGEGWLAESLQPLLAQADAVVEQQAMAGVAGVAAAPEPRPSGVANLHPGVDPGADRRRAGSASVDDDADGLTNTEEAWWCTDPLNPNSDGDAAGYTDGQEVAALLDFTLPRTVRWGYGPPFGPPNAWPNFNDRDGTHVNVCNDGD